VTIRGLPLGQVDCWFLDPQRFAAVADELAAVLGPDERARADRFAFDRDRTEYVVCRGVLRCLLARYGDDSPSRLRFRYSPRGKPELDGPANPAGLRFNLAHSHGAAVVAVTQGRPVGVDVERVRPEADLGGLVRTCFAPEEQDEFWSLPESVRPRAFFAGWTRKEAFLKATGEGLGRPLDSFAVSLAPDAPARLLRVDGDEAAAGWTLLDLTRDGAFAAAVAVPMPTAFVRVHDLFLGLLGLGKAGPADQRSRVFP
jgi:4'-phosphopantetheinyl transferase